MQKPLDINEPIIIEPSSEENLLENMALMLVTNAEIRMIGPKYDHWVEEFKNYRHAIGNGTEFSTNACPKLPWRDDHGGSAKDIRRRELADQALSKDKSLQDIYMTGARPLAFFDNHTSYFKQRGTLENILFYYEKFEGTSSLTLLLLPIAYGGIHLAAWGFEFPSPAESLLWKISCLIIMGLLAMVVLMHWISSMELRHFAYIMLILYVAARIFIVVESFISLRHVPIGVYAAVPWVQNIPHI